MSNAYIHPSSVVSENIEINDGVKVQNNISSEYATIIASIAVTENVTLCTLVSVKCTG